MPWCDTCDTQVEAVENDDCLVCGDVLDTADKANASSTLPWHFWIVILALVGYLAWRLVDLGLQVFG